MHNETPADRDEWGDGAPVNELEALLSEVDQLRATVVGLKEEALRERAELDNQRKASPSIRTSTRRSASPRPAPASPRARSPRCSRRATC
jgi:hypothetical protein